MLIGLFKDMGTWRLRLARAAVIASLGTIGCLAPANGLAAPDGCTELHKPDPDCGQHNMMMVGEQAVFVSHLPMFNSEHRFQVIMEVELAKAGHNLDSVYADDRKAHLNIGMYTVTPQEIFVLSRMFRGDEAARRTSFPGTVFRGHFERRGRTQLGPLTGVDVTAKRVVYAQEIGPPSGLSRSDALQYIVFGRGSEMFLAHRITQPPDFDQLLKVKMSGHDFTKDELDTGVLVTVPNRPNAAARRLRQGEVVGVTGHVTGAHMFLPVKVEVVGEPYFEEGELASDPTFDPTPLEIGAGFGN
ncbi:MAG: hypothetical protein JWO83_2475 [Caulobacteraceae bacterium]|jgi:hypothetical protein|nr:hypothetical protein [Caulobacteraceae bacterium]